MPTDPGHLPEAVSPMIKRSTCFSKWGNAKQLQPTNSLQQRRATDLSTKPDTHFSSETLATISKNLNTLCEQNQIHLYARSDPLAPAYNLWNINLIM